VRIIAVSIHICMHLVCRLNPTSYWKFIRQIKSVGDFWCIKCFVLSWQREIIAIESQCPTISFVLRLKLNWLKNRVKSCQILLEFDKKLSARINLFNMATIIMFTIFKRRAFMQKLIYDGIYKSAKITFLLSLTA
jgi:hypothetical protein